MKEIYFVLAKCNIMQSNFVIWTQKIAKKGNEIQQKNLFRKIHQFFYGTFSSSSSSFLFSLYLKCSIIQDGACVLLKGKHDVIWIDYTFKQNRDKTQPTINKVSNFFIFFPYFLLHTLSLCALFFYYGISFHLPQPISFSVSRTNLFSTYTSTPPAINNTPLIVISLIHTYIHTHRYIWFSIFYLVSLFITFILYINIYILHTDFMI